MKKIMQRFLGIAAAAALIVTYAVPVMATSAGPLDGDTPIEEKPAAGNSYTITLKEPENVEIESGSYGAYQIFSGTVPSRKDTVKEPGDNDTKLPITDIKWGNAFGVVTKDTATYESDLQKWQRNIVNFVYALATAYSDDAAINDHYQYAYAFKDFTDFKDFAGTAKNTLAAKYYIGVSGTPSENDYDKVDFDKLAIEVADVLADTDDPKDHKWLQQFADILGGYANDPANVGTYAANGYVNRYYESEYDSDTDTYKITVPAGYYMIRDFSTLSDENSAYSARLLFVATNVEQTLKADIPTLEKNIVRDAVGSAADPGSTKKDLKTWSTEAAGVGDVVKFKLTGTLPSDYINFIGGYTFEFKDILPDGLTLNKNAETGNIDTYVTVEAEGWFVTDGSTTAWDSSLKKIYTDSFDPDGSGLTHHHFTDKDKDKTYTSTLDKQTLTVNFPCLKEIVIEEDGKTYRLGYQDDTHVSKIYVTYTATVNSNALVYPSSTTKYNGNPNKAVLTYSDNPQAYAQTDQTTSKSATVYTYGAEITKVDAAEFIKTEKGNLGGAVFALVRKNPDSSKTNSYQIAEFALNKTIDDESSFKGQKVQEVSAWNKDITVTDLSDLGELVIQALTPDGSDNYKITSSSDPDTLGALNISGLDVGVEYYIVEVSTPNDSLFATIDPFTLTLTAEIDDGEYTGLLADDTDKNDENDGIIMDEHEIKTGESLSIDKFVQVLNNDVPASTADKDGIAELIVANFKYVDLPSTGGTGTYIFYIIGGVVVAASLVLFFLSRKKTTK